MFLLDAAKESDLYSLYSDQERAIGFFAADLVFIVVLKCIIPKKEFHFATNPSKNILLLLWNIFHIFLSL